MIIDYNESDVRSLHSKLESIEGSGWSQQLEKAEALSLTKKEFYIYCFEPNIRSFIWNRGRYGSRFAWIDREVIAHYIMKHNDIADVILEDPSDDKLVSGYIYSPLFNPLRDYDSLVKSESEDIRVIAAQFCGVNQLISLKKDKSKKVRRIVYGRLGPVGHIDDMLSDRSADIRHLGVSMAPLGYAGLSNMTGEISRSVFSELIKKIKKEDLPLMLSNRNLKDSYILKQFEKRMSGKY